MTRPERLSLSLLLSLFALAGVLRLNDLSLYTDSTRYVIWAESLSRGLGWVDNTQPVPEAYVVNAPFYPVVVAPSQWISAGSLLAAKGLTLLTGLGALLMFFLWLREWMPVRSAHGVAWLFALTPLTLVMFTEALSEAPFFLLLFFVFWMRERSVHRDWTTAEAGLTIAALALLPLLREISVAVVGAFLLDALFRRQNRFALALAVSAAATVGLWTLRNMVLVGVPESSQSTNIQFVFEHFVTPASSPIWQEWLQRFIINVRSYQFELSGMVLVPFPLNLVQEPSDAFVGLVYVLNAVKGWTAIVFLPLLGLGIWTDLRTSTSSLVRSLFFLFYAAIILLYPLQDIRFFLPAVPFMLLWTAIGFRRVASFLPRGRTTLAFVAAGLLASFNIASVLELLGSNQRYLAAVDDHRTGRAVFRATGYYATPWELAGEALTAVTAPDVVVASSSKEIVPFVGGRKVLEVNRAVPLPMFESMLREQDVTVLLVQQVRSGIRSHEVQIAESRRFRYDTIAATGWLTAYRVRNRAREGLAPHPVAPDPMDGIVSLLYEARQSIHAGRFREADSVLALANSIDPVNAELAFQRVAVAALAGALPQAVAAQQRLFSTPRSTSYSPPGRVLLTLAQTLDAAATLRGSGKAQLFFQAGRIAWDLGYPASALRFTDSAIIADHEHFEALLWGTHYRFQTGDTLGARRHLEALIRLDPANPVVHGFRQIDSLSTILRRTAEPGRQAARCLDLSRIYESIGLPEEALDMADKAWSAMPSEAKARTAEILERTGRTAGAERYRRELSADGR